jgi:hypothetical protein
VKPCASAFPVRKPDFVHEGTDDENAAATGLEKILGSRGICQFFQIEPFALIFNDDFNVFSVE